MSKKLYVGNLPYNVDDDELNQMVAPYGEITSAKVISDKFTNRSKGFGFVEFANDADADRAMNELNGREIGGRPLNVNEARPMAPRAPREGGFGGGGGGGGRGDRRGGGGGGRGGFNRRERYPRDDY